MIKQIMVGSKRYEVQQKNVVLLDGEQVGARFDGETSTIIIAGTLGIGAKPHALMHEIVHSILFDGGYAAENDNEKLVNDIAQQIILLIRQNPHLVKYIQSTGTVDQSRVDTPSIGDLNDDQIRMMVEGDEDD